MEATLDIDTIQETLLCWRLYDDLNLTARTRKGDSIVPDELLNQVHPLFAHSLRAAMNQDRQRGVLEPSVTAVYSSITKLMLTRDAVSCRSQADVITPILFIDQVIFSPDKTIMLAHLKTDINYVRVSGMQIPFLVDYDWLYTTFTVDALQEAFPGWEKRWGIASALELHNEEQIDYTFFQTSPQSNISLSGINFQ